jgi:hypothetical protein
LSDTVTSSGKSPEILLPLKSNLVKELSIELRIGLVAPKSFISILEASVNPSQYTSNLFPNPPVDDILENPNLTGTAH